MMRIAAAASTIALWPSGASASSELGLSNDGVTWSSTLPSPLFDSGFRWVPGDRQQESFWVRNMSTDDAVLDITLIGSAIDSLMQTGDLDIEVRAGDGPWHSTNQVGRHRLVRSMQVDPGQRERVTVAVDFDPTSSNTSQVKSYELEFEVRLTQDVSGHGDDGHGHRDDDSHHYRGDNRSDDLPGTGGPSRWLAPLGAGLTVGGAAFVAAARKERRHG
jgi:hypothetical protein